MTLISNYLDAGVAIFLQVLLLNEHCYLSQPRDRFGLTLPTLLPSSVDPCPFQCKLDLWRRFQHNCTRGRREDGAVQVSIGWTLLYPMDSSDTDARVEQWDQLEYGWLYRGANDSALILKTSFSDQPGSWFTLSVTPDGESHWYE